MPDVTSPRLDPILRPTDLSTHVIIPGSWSILAVVKRPPNGRPYPYLSTLPPFSRFISSWAWGAGFVAAHAEFLLGADLLVLSLAHATWVIRSWSRHLRVRGALWPRPLLNQALFIVSPDIARDIIGSRARCRIRVGVIDSLVPHCHTKAPVERALWAETLLLRLICARPWDLHTAMQSLPFALSEFRTRPLANFALGFIGAWSGDLRLLHTLRVFDPKGVLLFCITHPRLVGARPGVAVLVLIHTGLGADNVGIPLLFDLSAGVVLTWAGDPAPSIALPLRRAHS